MMTVFFRDDDLGWEHDRFLRVLELFREFDFQLNAAAIPLESTKLFRPGEFAEYRNHLEVHSHGFSHANHETTGKKAEFGRGRDPVVVPQELADSLSMAGEVFGEIYFPAFTPPWNRIDGRFIPLLIEAGFKVLSRDGVARSKTDLLELNVELDLHTDKQHPRRSAEQLVPLVERSPSPCTGIMLHHGHMTDDDFQRLRDFLAMLKARGAHSMFFSELHRERGI